MKKTKCTEFYRTEGLKIKKEKLFLKRRAHKEVKAGFNTGGISDASMYRLVRSEVFGVGGKNNNRAQRKTK